MPARQTPTRHTATDKAKRQTRPRKPPAAPAPEILEALADEGVAIRGGKGQSITITTETAAVAIGMGVRTLGNYVAKGAPVPKGGFKTLGQVGEFNKWLRADIERKAKERYDDLAGSDGDDMERHSDWLDNKMKEIKIATMLGELLPRARYEHNLSLVLAECNSLFRGMGVALKEKLAAMTDPDEIEELIDQEVADMTGRLNVEEAMNPNNGADPFADADGTEPTIEELAAEDDDEGSD